MFNYVLLVDVIECVEVICGFVLMFYGVDVLGGVINIIIKKYIDSWSGVVFFSCLL